MVVVKTITIPISIAQEWERYKQQANGANLSKLLSELLVAYLRKEVLDGRFDRLDCE